jgi:hypothetical protein
LISLYNALSANINTDWQAIIYTSPSASLQYAKELKQLGLDKNPLITITISPTLQCNVFHMEIYNAFLKDNAFWKNLLDEGYNKCIIVQDDGILIDGDTLQQFMEYDYIGAPWADAIDNKFIKEHINNELVGNGGFSIRDVSKSYNVCCKYEKEKHTLFYHNINEIPEDVYFVQCLKLMGNQAKIAPLNVARRFAVEQVFQYKPAGFHKFWMYHTPDDTLKMCESWS